MIPFLALTAFGSVAALGQPAQQLTPREIFYTEAAATAKQTSAPTRSPAKPVAKTVPAQKRTEHAETKSTPKSTAAPTPAKTEAIEASTEPTAVPDRREAAPTQQVHAQLVSVSRRPLGIRLSVIRIDQYGQPQEVDPESVFHAGDRVRLNIRVADRGYLYVINRGSSGTWTQLFPSPDLPNATNEVLPNIDYSVPPGRTWVVSNPPGSEKLFVILSRTPELDTDALTLDMSGRTGTDSKPGPSRRQEVSDKPANTTMAMALPPMNDAAVDRLRNAYARDLIIEKVDENTPGDRKEKALYAVSPASAGQSRVVLDFQIKHQ